MVGSEYTVCPMCGGEDGQGCYKDCPSEEIPRLVAERSRLIDRIDERDAEIKRLRAELAYIAKGGLAYPEKHARTALAARPKENSDD